MKIQERIVWLLVSGTLLTVCAVLWALPRFNGAASESKEQSNVRGVAGQAANYAEANSGCLPRYLSDLVPDHLQLGEEDRSLIYELSGNRDVPAKAQKFPTLLRYAIVTGSDKAIVHQVPDSNDYRDIVWQRLVRNDDEWILDGESSSGSFAELAIAMDAIPKNSEQNAAGQPATRSESK